MSVFNSYSRTRQVCIRKCLRNPKKCSQSKFIMSASIAQVNLCEQRVWNYATVTFFSSLNDQQFVGPPLSSVLLFAFISHNS